jgi:hypothetical protein
MSAFSLYNTAESFSNSNNGVISYTITRNWTSLPDCKQMMKQKKITDDSLMEVPIVQLQVPSIL